MGVTAGLVRATMDDLRRLRANPAGAAVFVEGDAWAPGVRRVRPKGLLGLLVRLLPITIEEVDPDATPPPGARMTRSRPALELDASWQPLHYLLTGTAWDGQGPLAFLAKGGTEIAEDDEVFSSVRLLEPSDVLAWRDALGQLNRAALAQRCDVDRMIDAGAVDRGRHAGLPVEAGEVLDSFDALLDFVSAAAASGDGIVVYMA